jgi:DNA polymerase-3 subunit alpha
MPNFTHLHLHTQYSILDGASNINLLTEKIKAYGMKAVAVTDHGNMFGVIEFYKSAKKIGIKPIIGCEVYVAKESRFRQDKEKDKKSDHLILLAKNLKGYYNLIKLVTYGWTEGFYRKPRIDTELLKKYSEGIIASTACLAGALPRAVLSGNLGEADTFIQLYKDIFGEDFYLEMQRHKTENPERDEITLKFQEKVNTEIIKLSKKHGVKYIATNDVHFINQEDADAHDILIALSTGKDLDDPTRIKYSGEEYLKSPEQMAELFSDFPDALENTQEIVDKIEEYNLEREPLMPEFNLPEGFQNEGDYLRHIVYQGAIDRKYLIDDEIKERIDFELDTIIKMEFPGYFLIVWDFLKAAREMGVWVGPGRGSAAGSAVAYCLRITDIDPFKYGLLFERFLNPDRISMPDIDIDFDEDGRERILKWVVDKYGKKRVANIITFGSMAAKMAIRDVARVLKLPLSEADRLAKLVPEKAGITLKEAFSTIKELNYQKDSGNELTRKTLHFAQTLEGSVRHTGIHACGIIIGKDDLENHLPLITSKDSDLLVTQFDGKYVESVGLLKMDFLGLKTLSIIKDTLQNIKNSKNIEIDLDTIPFDDKKTFDIFSAGETTGLFQFESDGMKKHLKNLKPNRFGDLIAMNALYRPGPMQYIENFINRKHGKEKISYNLPEMEEILSETYGVTVYQEQVMLLSQKLAGFSKGEADLLRKAMGKKIKQMMDDLKVKFKEGCIKNGHNEKIIEKIWEDWEKFAEYAFNKSHSTGYAYLSYQTAYLKAHYPGEFMCAVLSRNLSDIKKVSQFMGEAKRMGLDVLLPSINESFKDFTVNEKGQIRFGLGGIKNVGEAAVDDIITERTKNGKFKGYFDFIERISLHSVNKRTIEALAYAGAFDELDTIKRSQYFTTGGGNENNFIEESIKYGNKYRESNNSIQRGFFESDSVEIKKPDIPEIEEWNKLQRLKFEKEVIGIYLSDHPLDEYKLEIDAYCNADPSDLEDLERFKGKEVITAGIIKDVFHGTTKTGKLYGNITLEGYKSSHKFFIFGNDYIKYKNFFISELAILIKGKVQKKWSAKDENDIEFSISNLELLSEAKKNMIKTLTLTIPTFEISEQFIEECTAIFNKFKGKKNLEFNIYDPEENINLKLFSRSKLIEINTKLIQRLEEFPNLEYKLS